MGKRQQRVRRQHQRHWGRWLIGIFGGMVLTGLIGLLVVQGMGFSLGQTSGGPTTESSIGREAMSSQIKPSTDVKPSSSAKSSQESSRAQSSSQTASSSSAATTSASSSADHSATGSVDQGVSTTTPPPATPPAPGQNHLAAASQYAFDVQQVRAQMYGQGSAIGQKTVFLTFDDGINPTITPQILAILQRYQVHATFFLVGKAINQSTRALLLQEYQSGHGIAIHSFDHNYSRLYPKRRANATQILAEAEQTQAALRQYLGQQFRTRVWRYPGGHMSWQNLAPADQALRQYGYHWMDWNAASGDALGAKEAPKTVAQMVQYHAHSLSYFPDHGVRVVLMHDAAGKQLTVAALPQIIEFYQQRGYRFGILS